MFKEVNFCNMMKIMALMETFVNIYSCVRSLNERSTNNFITFTFNKLLTV